MSKDKEKTEKPNRLNPSQIALKTLKYWPWVLLSVIFWMALAFVYLKIKAPTYKSTAKVIISDAAANNSFSLPVSNLGFGMFGSNQMLLDEVVKMESPDLMETVIKRLGIDYKFEKSGTLHREQAYGDSLPINFSAPTWKDDDYAKLTIEIAKNGDIHLSNFKYNADKIDFEQKTPGRLGHPIKTSAGYITISSNPNFKKGEEYTLYMVKYPIDDAIKIYSKVTDIIPDQENSNAVGIVVFDKSKERATDIINTIIDVYNENSQKQKNIIKDITNDFIDERLAGIEKDLGLLDKDISTFQSENQLPDIEKAAAIYLTDNQMADQHLLELTNQVKVARYMRNYMEGSGHSNELLPTFTTLGVGTSSLDRQISEYNEKLMERNRLASNSSANHPMIVTLDEQLDQMRQAIKNTTNNEIASLNTQIENVLAKKGQVEKKIASTPLKANAMLESGRQQKVLESLYIFLLQKREENQMNHGYGLSNTEIIARARVDKKPAKPRKPLLFAVAFIMGLLTPYSIVYIKEIRNTRVNGRKDLDSLTAPLIAEIPLAVNNKKSKKDELTRESIVVSPDNGDEINDAFRLLRTHISSTSGTTVNDGKVVMITSLKPDNGKSFISVNLAATLALSGNKVLLIDGDMRKRGISETLGSTSSGLSDYLAGKISDWGQTLTEDSALYGATLMAAGSASGNSSELLENMRFDDMIAEMRDKFDYVIIDSPSAHAMADARIIDRVADRSLFVVRVGVQERTELEEVEKIYSSNIFKNMSIVLNGVKHA